jgi:hypothetical protein
MKKTIPALLLASALFACKKNSSTDDSPATTEPKYPVSFSVSNFLKQASTLRVVADSLTKITDIYYFAYGSDGLLKSSIHQDATKPGFGLINDSLPANSYNFVVYAATGAVAQNGGENFANASLGPQNLGNGMVGPLPDVFFKKMQATVNSATNPAAQPQEVPLNRITGLVNVEISNALPSSDPKGTITVDLNKVQNAFYFSTEQGSNQLVTTQAKRVDQTTFQGYVIGSTSPFSVKISYTDTTGTPQTKSIDNLTIEANKKTSITGSLPGLPNATTGEYLIKVNSSWGDSTNLNLNLN